MSAQGACDRRQRAAAVDCRTGLGEAFARQALINETKLKEILPLSLLPTPPPNH